MLSCPPCCAAELRHPLLLPPSAVLCLLSPLRNAKAACMLEQQRSPSLLCCSLRRRSITAAHAEACRALAATSAAFLVPAPFQLPAVPPGTPLHAALGALCLGPGMIADGLAAAVTDWPWLLDDGFAALLRWSWDSLPPLVRTAACAGALMS